jgi:amidase
VSGVHGFRALGQLRAPTREQLTAYASRQQLEVADAEIDGYIAAIAGGLALYDALEELPEPRVPLKHTSRDPGWTPTADEDPHNAVIRFCEVRGAAEGPLAGRRLGVKDCIAVAGVPMTAGGRRLPAAVPIEDAVVVERLLDAGVVITAKTNLEDMGLGLGEGSAFGASRNPRNPRYSTGGSSSGSGAAVASGLVDIALGADEGGSVRIPSAWCGLVGMKATHGLVPSYGMTYMDHTIDHIGPMTTSVAENALMLEIMAGSDWRDPQWLRADPVAGDYTGTAGAGIEGLRIGIITESLEPSGATPDVVDAFDRAAKVLTSLGATVVPVSVPLWTSSATILMGALSFGLTAMANSFGQGYGHLGRIDTHLLAASAAQFRNGNRDLPLMLRTNMLTVEHLRSAYQGVHFGLAQNLRLELRRQVDALFADVDLLITPTTPTGPFELSDEILGDAGVGAHQGIGGVLNTCPLDLTGHPALSVPSGIGEHDLPTALQIIGPGFGEALIYQAAFAFEDAVGPLPAI